MAIVYQHINKKTEEIFYIGIGKKEERAYHKDNRGKFWKDYISKYPDYEIKITHKDIIWEEACAIEKYLIAFYGRRDLGKGSLVNMTDGGDGILGYKFTKCINRKKEKNGFYRKTHSSNTIELLKNQKLGSKHPMWGKHQSKETIQKRSNKMKGRPAKNKKQVMHILDNKIFNSTHELQRHYGIGTGAFYSQVKKGQIIYI